MAVGILCHREPACMCVRGRPFRPWPWLASITTWRWPMACHRGRPVEIILRSGDEPSRIARMSRRRPGIHGENRAKIEKAMPRPTVWQAACCGNVSGSFREVSDKLITRIDREMAHRPEISRRGDRHRQSLEALRDRAGDPAAALREIMYFKNGDIILPARQNIFLYRLTRSGDY